MDPGLAEDMTIRRRGLRQRRRLHNQRRVGNEWRVAIVERRTRSNSCWLHLHPIMPGRRPWRRSPIWTYKYSRREAICYRQSPRPGPRPHHPLPQDAEESDGREAMTSSPSSGLSSSTRSSRSPNLRRLQKFHGGRSHLPLLPGPLRSLGPEP
ncbi:hypothetical protein BC567DRAFT_239686 [Phyllosticta citribraziliensis]